MKKRLQQLCALFLATTLAFGVMPMTAFAKIGDLAIGDYRGTIKVGDTLKPGKTISIYMIGEEKTIIEDDVALIYSVEGEEPDMLPYLDMELAVTQGNQWMDVYPDDTSSVPIDSKVFNGYVGNYEYICESDPDTEYFVTLDPTPIPIEGNSDYEAYKPVGVCKVERSEWDNIEKCIEVKGEGFDVSGYNYFVYPKDGRTSSSGLTHYRYNYTITPPEQSKSGAEIESWEVEKIGLATIVDEDGNEYESSAITFKGTLASKDPDVDNPPTDDGDDGDGDYEEPTPPTGGAGSGTGTGAGKGSNTNTGAQDKILNNSTLNASGDKAIIDVIKEAVNSGVKNPDAYINFKDYGSITQEGLKSINDLASKETAGKNVNVNTVIQFDHIIGNAVHSRISVDPVALAKATDNTIDLNVWFDQTKDKPVTKVKEIFDDAFVNKTVVITFNEKQPLDVNVEFAGKLDMTELGTGNLYFYSYDPVTNTYTPIKNPNMWLDKGNYTHFTVPFGGSIIITNSPLTLKAAA